MRVSEAAAGPEEPAAAEVAVEPTPVEEPAADATGGNAAALEAYLREIFDRVDTGGDGEISVVEAIKALRTDDEFAELLGFEEATRVKASDGSKDRLTLALAALDSDGDKYVSWDEFRRAALGEAPEAVPEPVVVVEPAADEAAAAPPAAEEEAAETVAEPTAEPPAEPAQEPTAEPDTELLEEEPAEEPAEELAEELAEEPAEEPAAEPAEELPQEPTAELTQEPTADPAAEPAEEPTAEPAAESEPTEELPQEPTAETTVEQTAELIEEPRILGQPRLLGRREFVPYEGPRYAPYDPELE